MVMLESEPIETFDPIVAANLWAEDKCRRPAYHRSSKVKVVPSLDVDESMLEVPSTFYIHM